MKNFYIYKGMNITEVNGKFAIKWIATSGDEPAQTYTFNSFASVIKFIDDNCQ